MSVNERFAEFIRRANSIAAELHIEVEFTTQTQGISYMSYEAPCTEIITSDTHEYLVVPGRVIVDGRNG
jgi:hypothetical protein